MALPNSEHKTPFQADMECIHTLVRRLDVLISKPEPGLSTWLTFYIGNLQKLYDLLTKAGFTAK